MLTKFASVVLAAALVCTLSGTPAFASTPSQPGTKTGETAVRPGSGTEADKVVDEKLKAEILKLVSDAKAGSKGVRLPGPQIQTPHRNNLSKVAKVGIGVGVGIAIAVLIFVSARCRNEPGAC